MWVGGTVIFLYYWGDNVAWELRVLAGVWCLNPVVEPK